LIWASYTIFADSIESVLERMIENTIKMDSAETLEKTEAIQEVKEIENKKNIRGVTGTLEASSLVKEKESATNKILIGIILILVGVVGFYFFNKNSNNANPALAIENKEDSSTKVNEQSKKEDLIVYKGIKQSDIKDDKVAIKNPDAKANTNTNNRLAVLYFDNTSKNKDLDPLRKTLADMLIADISDVENVNVVEREKLEDIIKELNLSKTKYIDRRSALKIGRMLSAKYIMIGSFMDPPIKGLPIRVDAKIIDVETSEIKWAKGVTGEKKDLYKIEKKLFNKFKKSKFVKNMTIEKK